MDQTEIPQLSHGVEKVCTIARHSDGHSIPQADAGGSRTSNGRRHERGISRREGIFRLAGAEEIQIARESFSEPLSRICAMSGLRRNTFARGSAGGSGAEQT